VIGTMSRTGIAVTLTAAVALVGACRRHEPTGPRQWQAWFDGVWQTLPRAAVRPMSAEDMNVETPDGVLLRLNQAYLKRNDYGCWVRERDRWPGPGWRDICIHLIKPAARLPGFQLEPRPMPANMADVHVFDSWRAEALILGHRRAIVERARGSGGIEGANRQRMIDIVLELRPGVWATLSGRTGDEPGYDELINVASTVTYPRD
jgi:hypothetical protein